MDKKLLAYVCITIILIFGALVAAVIFYDLDKFLYAKGDIFKPPKSEIKLQPYERMFHKNISRTGHSSPNKSNAAVIKIIGGIGALLLLGYLFVICYQKFMKDSKADSVALANALHKISLESGRTEYELFVIAAEEWSITEAQIDKDFKNYMASNVLPYYVKDLVRKNNDRINESLEKEEEIEPTSLWDLAKALLIFPGFILLACFLVITFGSFY